MRVLLDTHILIWALENNPNLPDAVKNIILDKKNDIYFSCISTWEIAIKHSLRPDELQLDEHRFVDLCKQSGFLDMTLNNRHIQSLEQLKPVSETNHKDPFDRILLAQSMSEQMMFITKDKKLEAYQLPNVLVC